MTLIEVIISLGLCGFLLTVALALAQTLGSVQADQAQIQTITENMRGAMAQLTRDVRLAGAGVSSGGADNGVSPVPARVQVVSVRNTNPDQIDLLLATGGLQATTLAGVVPTDDTLIVDAARGGGFATGDLVLLSDYVSGVLFQVGGTAAQQVSGVAGVGLLVAPAPSFPVPRFPPGSLVLRASALRYAVQQGDGQTLPASFFLLALEGAPLGLALSPPAPLAENIVDLQIAVGIDGLNGFPVDGVLTEVGARPGDDEWVFNVPGEALPPGALNPRAVRVSLVGRSALPGEQLGAGRPSVEDHAAGPRDRYRWRVQTETVVLRNLALQ